MAENIILDTQSIDYNIDADHAGQNFVEVAPDAEADFHLLENHITDDLGGYTGKNGTLVHDAFNDGDGILDGEFSGPERELLTDAGTTLDVKHQKTSTHYSQTNPHFKVMDEVVKNDPAITGKFGDHIFDSFLNVDAYERQFAETTISGLRTALVAAGDLRFTSDAMLGRKDIHGKFVYVDKGTDGKFRLKMNSAQSQAATLTSLPKSNLKIKMTADNQM